MRVLHINSHVNSGGAAKAMQRLHAGLLAAGCASRMMGRDVSAPRGHCVPAHIGRRWHWQIVERLLGIMGRKLDVPDLFGLFPMFGNARQVAWADVVNLHNLHGGYYNPLLPLWLSRRRPVVWTLHDMWAMTGHCSYAGDCQGWLEGCEHCPRPSEYPPVRADRIPWLYRFKRFVYGRSRIQIVTPSEWLASQVRKSPLLQRFRAVVIPNGLDTRVFQPIDQEAAKRVLGLPVASNVVVTGAFNLKAHRKGFDLLTAALKCLAGDGGAAVHLVTFGAGDDVHAAVPFPVTNIGSVSNERLLAVIYSAGDVFVGPTRAETFGQVFSESMSCGTPCVAFRATAIPEVVRDGETGYLARPEDPEDLAACIRRMLANDEARRRMATRCREVAVREYDVALMARRYQDLYQEAMERRRSGAPGDGGTGG